MYQTDLNTVNNSPESHDYQSEIIAISNSNLKDQQSHNNNNNNNNNAYDVNNHSKNVSDNHPNSELFHYSVKLQNYKLPNSIRLCDRTCEHKELGALHMNIPDLVKSQMNTEQIRSFNDNNNHIQNNNNNIISNIINGNKVLSVNSPNLVHIQNKSNSYHRNTNKLLLVNRSHSFNSKDLKLSQDIYQKQTTAPPLPPRRHRISLTNIRLIRIPSDPNLNDKTLNDSSDSNLFPQDNSFQSISESCRLNINNISNNNHNTDNHIHSTNSINSDIINDSEINTHSEYDFSHLQLKNSFLTNDENIENGSPILSINPDENKNQYFYNLNIINSNNLENNHNNNTNNLNKYNYNSPIIVSENYDQPIQNTIYLTATNEYHDQDYTNSDEVCQYFQRAISPEIRNQHGNTSNSANISESNENSPSQKIHPRPNLSSRFTTPTDRRRHHSPILNMSPQNPIHSDNDFYSSAHDHTYSSSSQIIPTAEHHLVHGTIEDENIQLPYSRMNLESQSTDQPGAYISPSQYQESTYTDANVRQRGGGLTPGGLPTNPSSSFSQRGMISGATLSFHHISYEVKTRKTMCSKPVIKTVLNDVSGILRPGMNAIMGPTGSGKSSLLDVLAGRKDPKFLTGQVLIDGKPQPKNFKCLSGYVVQDDIVMGTLTVRENLNFSAALRLTVKCTAEERRQKVDDILDELGLVNVADSKVGTELFRGVSGGERKRTSIGMELITEPPVLFLDEPTTGLDAFMAGQVLKTLKALSRRGRTIIFSIHQPKYSIYKLFDSLTLVYRGQLFYHGPAKKEPIKYFSRMGFICENHNNPPDFFMDVIHGEAPQRQDGHFANGAEISSLDDDHNLPDHTDTQERMNLVGQHLVQEWNDSEMARKIAEEVSRIANRLQESEIGPKKHKNQSVDVSFTVPFCRQLSRVCWRTTLNLLRDPLASVIQTAVYLFFALSMGTVYFQMGNSFESGIQNRVGLFFFCTLQVIFVNLASIELFIKERVLFIHENSSGYYQVSVYFFSKILCDILPTKVLPVILFMPICYWMAGLKRTAGAFLFFELLLCLTTLAAAAIALFISASVTVFGLANAILSIVYVFMMAFAGYLINLKTMAGWLSWLRYLSVFRYSMSGLLVMEMEHMVFCSNRTSEDKIILACQNGTEYLSDQEIPYGTAWDIWYNVVGQIIITIIFFVLCYVQLRMIKKYK